MKTKTVGTDATVIGSTGKKYTVSKTKGSKVLNQCSCDGWTKHTPRKNCRHIISALAGILDTRKENLKIKKENNMKVVVKSVVKSSLNIKKASEVIYKLISKAPGKLVRETLREKSGLDRSTVAGACKSLWKSKKIRRVILKSGSAGPYILYPAKKSA